MRIKFYKDKVSYKVQSERFAIVLWTPKYWELRCGQIRGWFWRLHLGPISFIYYNEFSGL